MLHEARFLMSFISFWLHLLFISTSTSISSIIFIGPKSDHCLPLSLTYKLMLLKLDDVTLIESDTRCSMISLIENLKNITFQTKPTKPNLPNQTKETKTYQIEFTKPNLVKLNIELLIDLKHESKSTQSLGPLCLWQCFQHQLSIIKLLSRFLSFMF